MARRKHEGLFEVLAELPWWLSVMLGGMLYAAFRFAPLYIQPENPVYAGLDIFAKMLPGIAPYATLPFMLTAVISAVGAYRRRKLLDRQTGIESIRQLPWQDFELLVAEAFRRQSYAVEESGGGGADGGVDLRLRKGGRVYVVQCKRWKTLQVGVGPVRELYGVMTAEMADGAFFIVSGGFTANAISFANENGLHLMDGETLLDFVREVQVELPIRPTAAPPPRPTPLLKLSKELWAATTIPDPFEADPLESDDALSPACPACGAEMVLRMAKRGANAGQRFWGCVLYPNCKGTVDFGPAPSGP